MTYSGLLMLVIGVALAQLLFGRERATGRRSSCRRWSWPSRSPSTRSAWVGVCAAAALLFALKDFRLLAVLPIVAAIFFAVAPAADHAALHVDVRREGSDQSRSRRDAARRRAHDRAHPLVGVGPNMVERALRASIAARTRSTDQPAPAQRPAADRRRARAAGAGRSGCGSSSRWSRDLCAALPRGRHRVLLAAAALAAMVAMLAAGLFEYNFGDSEVPDAVPAARHAAVRRGAPDADAAA